MKKRSKRLQPVANHAKNQEQDAARTFAAAQQRVSDSEEQLVQLEGFRDEYINQYKSVSQEAASMTKLLDYQAFIARLNQGIGQANNTIDICRQQRDILKQQWLQRRVRRQALETVVDKYQQVEAQKVIYAEQMELEEFTQHRFHQRRD